HPMLLKGSPGKFATRIRAGVNPLVEWQRVNVFHDGNHTDIEAIVPGRFTPIIFNDGRRAEYMRGWRAATIDANTVQIINPENKKYIYDRQSAFNIHFIQNGQGSNIVEFLYDSNGLPLRQNDLTDPNLYISYHYTGTLLTEIREHAGETYRQFIIEYDNGKVSFVGGGCAQCGTINGNRKYFYDYAGNIKYEKAIDNQIIYEYAFDSKQRLTEKWLGQKQNNHPVCLITYTDDSNGYQADKKDYIDNISYRAIREYYSNAHIILSRTTCEMINENIDYPAGEVFTEQFIYDVNTLTGRIEKLSHIKPKQNSARTEYVYDVNTGEILCENVYDINNNPVTTLKNIFEYLDSNGLPASEVNEISIVRIVQSEDVYGNLTYYQYADSSNYPTQIILPTGLKQQFAYDADKQVTEQTYIDNNTAAILAEIYFDYDEFANLISQTCSDGNDINDVTEYHFSDFGEITRIKSPAGVIAGESYDNYGRLISEYTLADANEIAIEQPDLINQYNYSYNSDGLLQTESAAIASGRFEYDCPAAKTFTNYQYDALGRIIKIIEDVNGKELETFYEYNRLGEITKITKPGGMWIEYIYDGRGLIINEITGSGSNDILIAEYAYDENGNCITKTDEDGSTSFLQYDQFDRIKYLYMPAGAFTGYAYNNAGDITSETLYDVNSSVLNQKIYEYDSIGRCKSVRERKYPHCNDENDFFTEYTFDCRDNVIAKTIKANNEANDIITHFLFDHKNRLAGITDPMSKSRLFTYDKDDSIKTITNELNLTSITTYDSYERAVKNQKPDGSYILFAYDSLGRCIRQRLFDANNTAIEQKRTQYDALGNVEKEIIMAIANSADDANLLIDNIREYNFDNAGRVQSLKYNYNGGKEATEQYTYDNIGRIKTIIDPTGNIAEITYDVNIPARISGQILTITDGNQQRQLITNLKYDTAGRIIESTIADANLVTQYFYDSADRVVKRINAGIQTEYQYDNFNRITKIINGSIVTEFAYDKTGRLAWATAYDPNNQTTRFEYDKNARVTAIVFADNSREWFKYDAAGNIYEKTMRSGEKIYFGYDTAGNLAWQSDAPDGNMQTAEFLVEFEYNANGLITYAAKSIDGHVVSQSEFEYNGFGKIITESTSLFELAPVVFHYDYDQAGNLISQTSNSSRLDFTHDGLGRIKSISRNDVNLAQIDYLGSAVSKNILFEPGIEYTADFDQIGRINRCASQSGLETIIDLIYSYNSKSQRSACVYNHLQNSPAEEYEYDTNNRLSRAEYIDGQNEDFAYDAIGNRTEVTGRYGFIDTYYHNILNQYSKIHTDYNFAGFTWDANLYWDDNCKLTFDTMKSLEYEYDMLGNLIEVKSEGQTIVRFVYDALGRRIRKTTPDSDVIYYYDINNRIAAEYEINQQQQPVFTAEYIYGNDFADSIAKFLYETTFDPNGVIKLSEFCQTYLFSTGQSNYDSGYDYDSSGSVDLRDFRVFADENIISFPNCDSQEKHWYYLKDALGSVVAVVGGNINNTQNREFFYYDAFGKPDHVSGKTEFMFAGMFYDHQIEKYYCVNRYYDPDLGIFLSTDPLLFADGFNLYTYAKNNPVMLTDRLGLKSSLVEEIKFLIGKGQIRTAAEKLTDELKKSCNKINSDCKARKCIAGALNPNCRRAEKCFELYRKALEYDKQINSECAKAAAIGTLAGTAQGLLNTVNGVQDAAVSTMNLATGIWNSSGALIYDKQLGYTPSPDWSRDLIVHESENAHDASKFLGGNGLITVVTAGTGSGQAAKSAQQGIYEFTSQSGKTYVGQSSNIPRRIAEHVNSGKLLANDLKTVKTTQVTGGKIAREIAEQTRIDRLGGVKNLENVRNAIGPARSNLMRR
ncbi:MAG: RHS repeat-associated core domain-containing protein, partial [Phycisphaerales bacterium]